MKTTLKPKRKNLTPRQRMLQDYFTNAILIAALNQAVTKPAQPQLLN
jgi:hypothetical protein